MNPRSATTLILAAAAVAIAVWAGFGSRGPGTAVGSADAPAGTPVVLYLIDTLRADRLGLYGYPRPTSPNLDALARESVVFDAAYAAAPWTLPSVASLRTSRPVCEHGVVAFGAALNPGLPTLAERLQAHGWATGAYYQNIAVGPVAGLDRGYQLSEMRRLAGTGADGSLAPHVRTFLERTGGVPFLLDLHTMEPHNVHDTPPRFLGAMGHVPVDTREELRAAADVYRLSNVAPARGEHPAKTATVAADHERATAALAARREAMDLLYDAAVRRADANLGDVIAALKEAGVWDRALVIVLADHGEELGDHGRWFHGQSVYEELVRVPLLVRFPGGAHAGRRVAAPVSLLDIVPTVLEVTGVPDACSGCRGTSLLRRLEDRADAAGAVAGGGPAIVAMRVEPDSGSVGARYTRAELNVALREGPAKGIVNRGPDAVELYDLASDPAEQRDLAGVAAARAAALETAAERWLAACRAAGAATPPVPAPDMDDGTRANLRALGYLR